MVHTCAKQESKRDLESEKKEIAEKFLTYDYTQEYSKYQNKVLKQDDDGNDNEE